MVHEMMVRWNDKMMVVGKIKGMGSDMTIKILS
jgi:hypothetical protein